MVVVGSKIGTSAKASDDRLVYFPITAIMVIVIMIAKNTQKSASDINSNQTGNNAASQATVPVKESFTAKLHRWFDIRQMNMTGRYAFLGIVIIFTVLLFFFIGLGIDFVLQQPATMALWGIGLGSVLALIFTWRQLMKLVDQDASQTKGKSNSSSSQAKAKVRRQKSPERQDKKRRQSVDTATELAKLSPEEQRILAEASMANAAKNK